MNFFHRLTKNRKKDSEEIYENMSDSVQSFDELLISEPQKTMEPASCWVINGESKKKTENSKEKGKKETGKSVVESNKERRDPEQHEQEIDAEWKLQDKETLIIYRNGELRGALEEKQIREEVWNQVTKVFISEGITEIPIEYFRGLKNLHKVVFPSTLKKIGFASFKECVELQSIEIPEGVTLISARAFEGCINLETVKMPSSVTYIGDKAFYTDSAFFKGKLKDIYVSEECKICGGNGSVKHKNDVKDLVSDLEKSDDELQKLVDENAEANAKECQKIFELGRKNIKRKDYKKAIKLVQYAADHGYTEACFLLAYCYEHGIGVTYSGTIAESYYKNGMNAASKYAQYRNEGSYTRLAFLKAAEEGEALFKNAP